MTQDEEQTVGSGDPAPPSDLNIEIGLIEEEVSLAAAPSVAPDERFLTPVRWFGKNLAWAGGILFFGYVAMDVALVAHLDPATLRSLSLVINLQAIAIQSIPFVIPTLLAYLLLACQYWASESSSILAPPVYYTLCLAFVLVAFVLAPWPAFIVFGLLTVGSLLLFTRLESVAHEKRRVEQATRTMRRRVKAIRKSSRRSKTIRGELDSLAEQAELWLHDESLSHTEREPLQLQLERINSLRTNIDDIDRENDTQLEAMKSFTSQETERVQGLNKQKFNRAAVAITDKVNESRNGARVLLTIALTVVLLSVSLTIVDSKPWLPSQQFLLKHDRSFSGYILGVSGTQYTVMTETSRTVILLPAANIARRFYCQEVGDSSTSSLASILFYSGASRPKFPICTN
jgi:hypothetical protein